MGDGCTKQREGMAHSTPGGSENVRQSNRDRSAGGGNDLGCGCGDGGHLRHGRESIHHRLRADLGRYEPTDTSPSGGYGIVNHDYRMGTYEITNDQWNKFTASLGVPVTGSDGGLQLPVLTSPARTCRPTV